MKQTTVQTLFELLKRPSIPLSRKVAAMKKVLYLDRAWIYSKLNGPVGDVPSETGEPTGLYGQYLIDILKRANTLLEMQAMDPGQELVGAMPKTFLNLEDYRQQIHTPYLLKQGQQVVQEDQEVFRSVVPYEDASLTVLERKLPRAHYISKDEIEEIGVFNPPAQITNAYESENLDRVRNGEAPIPSFAISRLLRPRIGRFLNGERERIVESGDAPSYENVLLFPLSTLRDLGPIRSGSLAQDVSLGMSMPTLMQETLAEHPIEEQPSAASILNLGVKGNILGTVTLRDWIAGLELVLEGGGDAYSLLRGYGLSDMEFSKDQMDIITQKIEQRLASLKVFLKEQREANATSLANLKFAAAPLLNDADATVLLSRLEADPDLLKMLEDVRLFMGELASVDVNWFSQVFLKHPDYTIAILGQQAAIVARERQKFLRNQYLEALHNAFRGKLLDKHAGKPPTPNTCVHVEELEKTRRAGHRYASEARDVTRMKLLVKFFNRFRGHTVDDWVHCNVCKEHLVCGHEFLQLQEFLRPNEQEVLHKELLLKFSGGAFSGKFICKVCGQAISELELDARMEFDDEGRPIASEGPTMELSEEDSVLTMKMQEIDFGKPELNLYYRLLKKLASMVGIDPEETDYRKMVARMGEYMSKRVVSRETYAKQTAGKKVDDYDIYRNVRLISSAGATLLLNAQARIPDYPTFYTTSSCAQGLGGYPLTPGENRTGLVCIIQTLAAIRENEPPWNLTGLQKETDVGKRAEKLSKFVTGILDILLSAPDVQVELTRKREYLDTAAKGEDVGKSEQIAKTFRPIPYVISTEEAAAEVVLAESATDEQKASAWIRGAHAKARKAATLNPESAFTETTCCLHPLTQPDKFWKDTDLPALASRSLGSPPFRTHTLRTTFYTEKPLLVEASLKSSEYYKLFMRVCYKEPNKGLPHELGLGDEPVCIYCGLKFPQTPSLVFVEDITDGSEKKKPAELKAAHEANIKASIESQGVVINETTFLDLLKASQQKSFIADDNQPKMPETSDTFQLLAQGPPPLDDWEGILADIQLRLQEMGTNAKETDIATAADRLLRTLESKEADIARRLPESALRSLKSFARRTPRECGENLLSYLVVPFQRWLAGVRPTQFKMLESYEVSEKVIEDVMEKGLAAHLKPLGKGAPPIGIIYAKAQQFIKQMSWYCKYIFPELRAITTPGGLQMVNYLLLAFVIGPVERLLNPQQGVLDVVVEAAPDFTSLYTAFGQALSKYAKGSAIPSEADIREILEQRAEAEKQVKLSVLDKKSKDGRQVDRVQRLLGIGEYARGGSKAIQEYDDDEYENLRNERQAAEITDWSRAEEGKGEEALDVFNLAARYSEQEIIRNGAYAVGDQDNSDDT